jgi:hypothetical protein
MANTVKDPVCGMDIDPKTAAGKLSTRDEITTSARLMQKSLTRSLRSTLENRPAHTLAPLAKAPHIRDINN